MEPASTPPPPVSHPLRWFPELWESSRKRVRPQARLLGLSLLVGVISGLGAIVFFVACQWVFHIAMDMGAGYHPLSPGGEPPLWAETTGPLRPWALLLLPAIGGLLSGVFVFSLAPEAEGHGTDAAIAAYHFRHGEIRPRVPLVKLVASAVTLGFGGSGGREGPIAQIGAGFGSFLGQILRLRPADRRVLMAAGMGAGIAAIFRAPLAGALFAAEVLYRSPDFESDVIIPACLASVTAYSTFGLVFGWSPLFTISPELLAVLKFENPFELLPYSLLAVVMVAMASLYVRSFYGFVGVSHSLTKVPRHLRPALGAAASGLVALVLYYAFRGDQQVLSVLSFGYGILQDALNVPPGGETTTYMGFVLMAVALGKILTTSLTIGSGGSGGVFGPSMVIGGCGGGALGIWLHAIDPRLVPQPASFVIVGMAGFFAAAAKTPFSTLVIVSEMTGSYNLLLPTLWVCSLAFVLSDEKSIYSAQVEKRSLSPAHQGDYVREVLGNLSVRQFLSTHPWSSLHPQDRLPQIIEQLTGDGQPALPVIDTDGRLLGVVSIEDVYLASQAHFLSDLVVAADLMRSDVVALEPDDRLDRALELFVESDLLCLPVIEAPGGKVIGTVKRSDVSRTYLRYVQGNLADRTQALT
ncbi:MAG TPA: chloride channel protein [Pirellulales bacterium]|jgi:CIC family chloride channel protein|nr:chloride channel protein [Pirellulales bacterium]